MEDDKQDNTKIINTLREKLEGLDSKEIICFIFGYSKGKDKNMYLKKMNVGVKELEIMKKNLIEQISEFESYNEIENYNETESTEKGIYPFDPLTEINTKEFHNYLKEGIKRAYSISSMKEVKELEKLLFVVKFTDDLIGFSPIVKRNFLKRGRRFIIAPGNELNFVGIETYYFEVPQFYFFLIQNDIHIVIDPVEYGSYFNLTLHMFNSIKGKSKLFEEIFLDPDLVLENIENLSYKKMKPIYSNLDNLDKLLNFVKNKDEFEKYNKRFALGLVLRDGKIDFEKSPSEGVFRFLADSGVNSPATGNNYIATHKKRVRSQS
ncbi:MAG: hypothetical protein ACP5GR_05975 [Thermoplasmata archaeon]